MSNYNLTLCGLKGQSKGISSIFASFPSIETRFLCRQMTINAKGFGLKPN
jgi:hypothetical protein